MKVAHLEARMYYDLTIPPDELAKLPKKVGIVTSVQHRHQIQDVVKQIPDSTFAGQLIGCNANVTKMFEKKVDAFLFVGTGTFHPIAVALKTSKPVYTFSPLDKAIRPLDPKSIEDYKKKKKVSLMKYLHARRVGILVSTKPGQEHLNLARRLAEQDDKEYHIFLFDNLEEHQLENFPFIDMWVDTACPRIADEKPNIIEIRDVLKNTRENQYDKQTEVLLSKEIQDKLQ